VPAWSNPHYSQSKEEISGMSMIEIRMGGYQGVTSINTRAAVRFGEVLEERVGECVRFELIGSVLALGRTSGDLPVMVENGELALCYMSTVRFAAAVPELKILELPFIVPDRKTAIAALDGSLGTTFTEGMHARTPFRVLGFWDNGFRHVTNRVRPIRTPADCKGIRIRTQMSALHAEAMAALGFEPLPVDIKEFVDQIGGDRFQAQENPLTNTFHFGVHRYHRYVTLTGHLFGASAFICNTALYESWPREVRDAVDSAAAQATALQRKLAAEEDDYVLAQLDPQQNEVIQLTIDEHDAFVRAVEPVRARHSAELDPKLFELLG
jgi:TRAP-type transport system periplasmic protein